MIKDSVGNRLSEGQFVVVQLPMGLSSLRGRIKTVDEGLITRIGGTREKENGQITPGLITVEIQLPVEVDPRSKVTLAITRIWDPSGEDLKRAEVAVQNVS